MYVMRSTSRNNINMLSARHFITQVQFVLTGVGGGAATHVHISWAGAWEPGKKPSVMAHKVSAGAKKGVEESFRRMKATLDAPDRLDALLQEAAI